MINSHKTTWFTINIEKYTSSHFHRIITNQFQRVYDQSQLFTKHTTTPST